MTSPPLTPGQAAPSIPGRRGGGRTTFAPRGSRYLGIAVATAVAGLPLMSPTTPGNTAPIDGLIIIAMVSLVLWSRRRQQKLRLPYSFGMSLLMVAGAVAALRAGSGQSGLTVLQDGFVLLWGATVAATVRSVANLALVVRAWSWSGIVWATILVVAKVSGVTSVAGITAQDGGRASLAFHDPNLAGSYFVTALFIILATRGVRSRVLRALGAVIVLAAIVFTGSNGALVAILIGTAVAALVGVSRKFGLMASIALACAVGALVLAARPYVDLSQVQQRASDSSQLLRDSIGRSNESSGERQQLVSEGMRLYLQGDAIGVGPGRTKATFAAESAPYVKEAHDDYVATLVERGYLGGLGLVVLIVSVAIRFGRVGWRPLSPEVREIVPYPALLLGLGCTFLASAFFYEVLHFRHLWALLGLAAGLDDTQPSGGG